MAFAALLLWCAAGFRWWRLVQRPHAPALRAIAIALVAIAVAATVNVPSIARGLDRLVDWPNIADVIKQVGIVIAACGNQMMLLHLVRGTHMRPNAARARWTLAGLVSLSSVALFLAAGRVQEAAGDHFAEAYAGTRWLAESRLLVTVYAGLILGAVVVLCIRHATATALGRGVFVVGSGAAVMVVYCVLRVVYIGGHRLGYAVPAALYTAGTDLAKLGLPMVAIGTLAPAAEAWLRARRDLARLRPLRLYVLTTKPMVAANDLPKRAEMTRIVDHHVVQIQDGLYLTALDRRLPEANSAADDGLDVPAQRAAAIARWLRGEGAPELTMQSLATPAGVSDRGWATQLADAFIAPGRAPVSP